MKLVRAYSFSYITDLCTVSLVFYLQIMNSVENITDKIKNILKEKDAIIQSLDDNNKEHLVEVILKCQDAVDNLVVCAKVINTLKVRQ